MDKKTGKLALKILRELKARDAEYRAEREEWYRSGDGRRPNYRINPETGRSVNYGGKGYGFPYCPHGSSLWTDYDNICGRCEDGYSVYQLALWEAQGIMAKFNERSEWLFAAPASFKNTEAYRDVLEWVLQPLR